LPNSGAKQDPAAMHIFRRIQQTLLTLCWQMLHPPVFKRGLPVRAYLPGTAAPSCQQQHIQHAAQSRRHIAAQVDNGAAFASSMAQHIAKQQLTY